MITSELVIKKLLSPGLVVWRPLVNGKLGSSALRQNKIETDCKNVAYMSINQLSQSFFEPIAYDITYDTSICTLYANNIYNEGIKEMPDDWIALVLTERKNAKNNAYTAMTIQGSLDEYIEFRRKCAECRYNINKLREIEAPFYFEPHFFRYAVFRYPTGLYSIELIQPKPDQSDKETELDD